MSTHLEVTAACSCQGLVNPSIGAYSSAILVSAVGLSMWPHPFMKAFTDRDGRILRRTVVLFPTFQLFLIPVFLIGFAGVLIVEDLAQPDFILP